MMSERQSYKNYPEIARYMLDLFRRAIPEIPEAAALLDVNKEPVTFLGEVINFNTYKIQGEGDTVFEFRIAYRKPAGPDESAIVFVRIFPIEELPEDMKDYKIFIKSYKQTESP